MTLRIGPANTVQGVFVGGISALSSHAKTGICLISTSTPGGDPHLQVSSLAQIFHQEGALSAGKSFEWCPIERTADKIN